MFRIIRLVSAELSTRILPVRSSKSSFLRNIFFESARWLSSISIVLIISKYWLKRCKGKKKVIKGSRNWAVTAKRCEWERGIAVASVDCEEMREVKWKESVILRVGMTDYFPKSFIRAL